MSPTGSGVDSADRTAWILPTSLVTVALIVMLDWLTPAGIVVGILLGLPIIATAFSDQPRAIGFVTGAAVLGFLVAAEFGRGPISPVTVWAPNRVFAFLAIPASAAIALLLQRARLRAAVGQKEAARASDLNRLLLSLLAHDMRAPLSMAVEALEYVRGAGQTASGVDPALLSDVEQQLRRGLSAIDRTLALAPKETGEAGREPEATRTGRDLLADLEAEALSFASEAAARGKRLETRFPSGPDDLFRADPLLARQALAILIDNAVRHAVPGSIRVDGAILADELRVTVADDGPSPAGGDPTGSGIGLALCRMLVSRAGGDITRAEDGPGTTVVLRLPLAQAEVERLDR